MNNYYAEIKEVWNLLDVGEKLFRQDLIDMVQQNHTENQVDEKDLSNKTSKFLANAFKNGATKVVDMGVNSKQYEKIRNIRILKREKTTHDKNERIHSPLPTNEVDFNQLGEAVATIILDMNKKISHLTEKCKDFNNLKAKYERSCSDTKLLVDKNRRLEELFRNEKEKVMKLTNEKGKIFNLETFKVRDFEALASN